VFVSRLCRDVCIISMGAWASSRVIYQATSNPPHKKAGSIITERVMLWNLHSTRPPLNLPSRVLYHTKINIMPFQSSHYYLITKQ
jgi:hypothetical protein